MITELRIQNFAIIEDLTLRFTPGLTILTGETGAGKSIILDAVELLLGSRAEAAAIRTGASRAYIEGAFQLEKAIQPAIHAILEDESLLDDPDYLVLGREIRANGRSIARVNGRTVSVGLLKHLGQYLIDIHGQSEHLSLLNPKNHLPLLDRYAQSAPLLHAYQQIYKHWQTIRKELAALKASQRESLRRSDLLAYQIEEIETAHLQIGEDERLKQERDRLANAENISQYVQESLILLDEGTPDAPAAADLLGQASVSLKHLARLDSSQQPLTDHLALALETISDIAHALRQYIDGVEYNPERLNAIEERLDLIHRLKRKYGGSIADVLAYSEKIRAEMEGITHAEERIETLEKEERALLAELAQKARRLSQKRQTAAKKLSAAIEKELSSLHMSQARFAVHFSHAPQEDGLLLDDGQRVAFDASGYERVEFLIAPNPGEGLKPMAKIASGGETSRLMLALKNVLAQSDDIPTLIFDEIDQGIGGRIGLTVGEKLWQLSQHHQILCVTHLPQLAAFGTQHYHVEKKIREGRTSAQVTLLDDEKRLLELAQMLGGTGKGTLQSARELLQNAQTLTEA